MTEVVLMKQYIVDNSKSAYFGLSVVEVERYASVTYNETWIKVVLDFAVDGSFKEVYTWFKLEELTDY